MGKEPTEAQYARSAHIFPGRRLAWLLALAAAVAAMTLSAAAQGPGGESDSAETAQGRIVVRVQDQPGDDGIDDYRIEFGFFPEWVMAEVESWPAAIPSRSSWLPSSRFFSKSLLNARAAADNRGWLRSSLITVPAQPTQSPGAGQTEISGRVIARYHPDSAGSLRVEFGFVSEWAFTDTSSTAEALERQGVGSLPRARYLSAATIDARRDVWLRSSLVEVPLRTPAVVTEQPQAPVIDGISCSPSSLIVYETVTCTAALSGSAPNSWAWSGGTSSGNSAAYSTTFSSSGNQTISLTVTSNAGSDTESITLTVEEPLRAPVIHRINCSPPSPSADESVTCTASLRVGDPASYAWSGGGNSGSGERYMVSFSEAGEYTISLTVANAAGSDSKSLTLTVHDDLQVTAINSITSAVQRQGW